MKFPNFYFEKSVWKNGYEFVAGIDEVGRGAFAGPVVAGCVVFEKQTVTKIKELIKDQELNKIKINDSKKLSAKQRENADVWIKVNALAWGIGEATAREIDRLGIVKATNRAMRRAIGNANQRLHKKIQYLLIDAFYLPYIKGIRMPVKSQRRRGKGSVLQNSSSGSQKAIVKGDEKSFSIACSSIIAKVYRDKLMTKLGKRKKYQKYGWDKNKGYGTKYHREVINKFGEAYYHRKSFT